MNTSRVITEVEQHSIQTEQYSVCACVWRHTCWCGEKESVFLILKVNFDEETKGLLVMWKLRFAVQITDNKTITTNPKMNYIMYTNRCVSGLNIAFPWLFTSHLAENINCVCMCLGLWNLVFCIPHSFFYFCALHWEICIRLSLRLYNSILGFHWEAYIIVMYSRREMRLIWKGN